MSLRILGGEFRGRVLESPKTKVTRPTLGIMRQALFNILQDKIKGACVLDLYSGSGAIGLEALSRGAKSVTFVEKDRTAFSSLLHNVKLLHVEARSILMNFDVFLALKKMKKEGCAFDLVYADPPYAQSTKGSLLEELLLFLDSSSLLARGGFLFFEEEAGGAFIPKSYSSLQYVDSRTFSQSTLHEFINKTCQ